MSELVSPMVDIVVFKRVREPERRKPLCALEWWDSYVSMKGPGDPLAEKSEFPYWVRHVNVLEKIKNKV